MDAPEKSSRMLRGQIAACLDRGLPGPTAQRLFEPELAYGRHAGPAAADARLAAVLVLAYWHETTWFVPTIVRTQGMRDHAGQIALPGGAVDPGETPIQTALRELEEELGVGPDDIDVLGELTPLYVFNSNFQVQPILGLCGARPHFQPSAGEVAEVIEIPLPALLATANHGSHSIRRRGVVFHAPHIQIELHRIWGATAMILAEFMALMSQCAALGGD